MSDAREADLYPLSAALAEALRTARYGLFEAGVDAALQGFDTLGDLALAILAARRGRGVEVKDSRALVWGEAPDETRPAVDVIFTTKGGETQVLTVVMHDARAGRLWQAMAAAKPARKVA